MKRILVLFILLMVAFFGTNVEADTIKNGIVLDCDDNINSGANFKCRITHVELQNDSTLLTSVTSLSFTISLGSGITYQSPSLEASANGTLIGNDYTYTTTNIPLGIVDTILLKADAENDGTDLSVSITNVVIVSDTNYPISVASEKIHVVGTGNSILSLAIDDSTLIPSGDGLKYTDTFNWDGSDNSVVLSFTTSPLSSKVVSFKNNTITPNANNYTIDGIGAGSNIITIVVNSEAGVSKTYTLTITATDIRSTDNTLSALSITNGNTPYSIAFSPTTLKYTINALSSDNLVVISATLNNNNATWVSNDKPGSRSLSYGTNTFKLIVKAQNQDENTYTIVVNRPDNRSDNTLLKSIVLSDGKLTFDAEVLEYKTVVVNDVTDIIVEAIPEDTKSKVAVSGGKKLIVGENVITISVTSEKETTSTYKIIVTRQDVEAIPPSSNTNLTSIKIKGIDFEFNKLLREYSITIPEKTEKLSITAVLEDTSSEYQVLGNSNLQNGSVIKIRVVAEDGTTDDYRLNIIKEKPINWIIIAIIGASLLIIIFIVLIIISKKKTRKKNLYDTKTYAPVNNDSNVVIDLVKDDTNKVNIDGSIIVNNDNMKKLDINSSNDTDGGDDLL